MAASIRRPPLLGGLGCLIASAADGGRSEPLDAPSSDRSAHSRSGMQTASVPQQLTSRLHLILGRVGPG